MTFFAPPEVFSAWACTVPDDDDPAEPLHKATHLRVFAGLPGAFPLTAFATWVLAAEADGARIEYTDDAGTPIDFSAVPEQGVVRVVSVPDDGPDVRNVALEVFPPNRTNLIQLLDGAGREIAARTGPRYVFAAPGLATLRMSGEGLDATEFGRYALRPRDVLNLVPDDPALVAGLPLDGMQRWYLGVDDRADSLAAALARVQEGAPKWLNPMELPDWSPVEVDPVEERERVETMLAAGGPDVSSLIGQLTNDADLPWLQQSDPVSLGGSHDEQATLPRLSTLHMLAMDPGFARLFGSGATLQAVFPPGSGAVTALAVLGLLAVDRDLGTRLPHLAGWIDDDDHQDELFAMLVSGITARTGIDVSADLEDLRTRLRDEFDLVVKVAVAVAGVLEPAAAPSLPEPQIVGRHWQASDGETESSLFRTTFAFPSAPLAGQVAVARFDPARGWVTRHEVLDVSGRQRAEPRVFGHETDGSARVREHLEPGDPAVAHRAALVSDSDIPAEEKVLFRFHAADVFGRFGPPRDVTVKPPARPGPPQPLIRHWLNVVDEVDKLPGTGPASPGTVTIRIDVPGLDRLPAGSYPIVDLELDGTSIGLNRGEIVVPLDPLAPQARGSRTFTARFTDSHARTSPLATLTVSYQDRRPHVPLRTGIGLVWTSTPGPAEDVQLQLTWQAARAGALHRVYITDQAGVGLTAAQVAEPVPAGETPPVPPVPPSRGRVAEAGCRWVLDGAVVDKARFRLLPDTVEADAQGRAVLSTTMPRSLEAVQFVRVVPVTADGAEAPFTACGIVPVAVPDSRGPVPPRLEGSVDTNGFAQLTVVADALDEGTLRRDEAGLFNPAKPGKEPPRFGIRRAASAVGDPAYAREVQSGPLARKEGSPGLVFSARATDGLTAGGGSRPLEPFVTYTYWADVRMPPERRLPAAVTELHAEIAGVHTAANRDRDRPRSRPSPPLRLMRIPPTAPAAPPTDTIDVGWTTEENQVQLTLSDWPRTHPAAVGRYRLCVWSQYAGDPITRAVAFDGVPLGPTDDWPELARAMSLITIAAPPPGATGPLAGPLVGHPFVEFLFLRVGFVDPVGRLGGITTHLIPV